MLVLSRKQNESIQFPNLGIAVEILRVAGNTVRVGIDAPDDVRIIRGELKEHAKSGSSTKAGREKRHLMRNRLNTATLALHLLEKQLELGKYDNAEETLKKALNTFAELDQLASAQSDVATRDVADGCHALIVDDNANERELLAGYLRLCGYSVDGVEDGQAAMNYLEQHECPDVVLLDMQMPRMNGSETVNAIRINPEYRGIKVFAVSGMDPRTAEVTVGKRGVDRWFSKPIKPAEFAAQLGARLNRDITPVDQKFTLTKSLISIKGDLRMESQMQEVEYLADEMRALCELMERQRWQSAVLCEESRRIRIESEWIRRRRQVESRVVEECSCENPTAAFDRG